MSKEAVIIGYSGHAFVVLEVLLANDYKLIGYCEQSNKFNNAFQIPYLGKEDEIKVIEFLRGYSVFIGIGDNIIRAKIFKKMLFENILCPNVVHNSAYVSPKAKLGPGTIVMPGAVINSFAEIGCAVICNSSSIIEHESKVGDYSHIAPGAVLAGNVIVGEYSFVGANSVIKQGIIIGSEVVIGAGSVVTKNIPDGVTVYGNPARVR